MENNTIKRMIPLMVGAVLIITGVVVATILLGGSKGTPWGSISDETYYSYNGITVSEREWYDKARYSSYSYFLDLVDSKLIDVDELIEDGKNSPYTDNYDSDVTNLYLKFHQDVVYEYMYKTTDRQAIDFMDDNEKEELERAYYDNLRLVGIDTNNYWDDKVKARYSTEVARRIYALNELVESYISEDSDEEEYITDAEALEYWEDVIRYDGEVNAIVVTFNSSAEFNSALDELGYCVYEDNFYRGPRTSCDDTNPLDDTEINTLFAELYNIMNINYDGSSAITTDGTAEGIEYSQYDLNKIDTAITKQVFENLEAGEYVTRREMTGSGYYVALKISDVVPTIDSTEYDKIRELMALESITATYTASILSDLRLDSKIVIYDPVIESYHKYSNPSFKTSKDESDTYIASVKGEKIVVDDFYAYIEDSLATESSKKVMEVKVAQEAVSDSVSKDDKDDVKESVKDTVSDFKRGSFDSYGYSSSSYGESVFLATFYNATSLDDAIEKETKKLYVSNFYTDYDVIYGDNFYDDIYSYVMEQYNQYYKFNATEFVIYLDLNRDNVPDDFQEALDNNYITQADVTDFVNDLMDEIIVAEQLSVNTSFADALSYVVTNYNSINMVTGEDATKAVNSLYDHYEKGFKISTGAETTYTSTTDYSDIDEDVYQGLLNIYGSTMDSKYWSGFDEDTGESDTSIPKFITAGNGTNAETQDAVFTDLIISEGGVHLYIVGSGYERPKFHSTDDTEFNLTIADLEYVLTTEDDELDCDTDEDVDVNECIDEDEYELIYTLYTNVAIRLSNTYQKSLSLYLYLSNGDNPAVFVDADQNEIQNNRIRIYQDLVDEYSDFPTSPEGPFTGWFDKFSVNPSA